MVYVDSAPSYFYASKTVEDLANQIWASATTTAPYSLSALVDTPLDPDNDAHVGIIPSKLDTSINTLLPSSSTFSLLLYRNA